MERKQNSLQGALAAVGLLILILDSSLALEGARVGIDLCIKTVIPALFPFFVLSMMLTNRLKDCVPYPFLILGKLLGIPAAAVSVLIPSVLGGYPVGAKCVGDLYENRQISKENAEQMLAFCSNAGPSFLFGMVSGFFPERRMIWLLWIIHIISALLTAITIPVEKSEELPQQLSKKSDHPGIILSAAKAMTTVCCWVVLFRIILTFLNRWFFWMLPVWANVLLTGILELTNGCFALPLISDINIRFLLCSCMLSLGGVCILLQTMAVTKGLSSRYYLLGKLIQTAFSFLLSCILLSEHRVFIAPMVPILVILLRKIKIRYRNPGLLPV